MVSATPLGWQKPLELPPRRRRWWPLALVLVGLLLVGAGFIRLPYDAYSPGGTIEVKRLVSVDKAHLYPPRGRVLEVTVGVREGITLYEYLWDKFDSTIAVESQQQTRGGISQREYDDENRRLMSASKTKAEVVALGHLGIVAAHGGGALVESVEPHFPATGLVQPKDVIVAIDGKPIEFADDAISAIRSRHAGDAISLRVLRAGQPVDVRTSVVPGVLGYPVLGVTIVDKDPRVDTPFPINIDSLNVTGPSAGLAFCLELLDTMTPGELTGGATVAATGELGLHGEVLPIGGIEQKTVAVRRAHASIFLVPRENYPGAKAHAGNGLRVVAVDNVDDALRVLATIPGSNAASFLPAAPAR